MDSIIVSLGFVPELVPLILEGKKTATYRYGQKYKDLKEGDVVLLHNSETKEKIAKAEITGVKQSTFGMLPLEQEGHEMYSSKEDQRATFKHYYGKIIEDEEEMIILEFEIKERF